VRQILTRGHKLVMAVDPGNVTGWVLFHPVVDTDQLTGLGIVPVAWGEDTQQDFCDLLWRRKTARLAAERPDLVVIEDFTPRHNTTWQPAAVEVTGVCRWLMDGDPHRFFTQRVSDATAYGTPAKINPYRQAPHDVGRGGAGHAVMALRHAVFWTNTRWAPEEMR